MRASRIHGLSFIAQGIPALSLYALGLGLLAAGLWQIVIAVDAYYSYRIETGLVLFSLMVVNGALTAVIMANLLRRSSSLSALLRGDSPPTIAVWFIHFAVAVHASLVLPSLLPLMRIFIDFLSDIALLLAWTSLAGAALVLALMNRLRLNPRLALLGAVVSVAAFGCAVGYAPAIYGQDLRPMGWYAILVSAIPLLAFLTLFLRRARVFSENRWRRRGLAAGAFLALVCAVGLQMMANPADRFGAKLQAAMDGSASEVRFSDLTDFEWDAVEIYDPYTWEENLSPAAREGTDMISRSYFGYSEILDFVVFLKDGEVVYHEVVWRDTHTIRYPRGQSYPWSIAPEDAVFSVEYSDGGYRSLTLAE